jgi:hypothetical protein
LLKAIGMKLRPLATIVSLLLHTTQTTQGGRLEFSHTFLSWFLAAIQSFQFNLQGSFLSFSEVRGDEKSGFLLASTEQLSWVTHADIQFYGAVALTARRPKSKSPVAAKPAKQTPASQVVLAEKSQPLYASSSDSDSIGADFLMR